MGCKPRIAAGIDRLSPNAQRTFAAELLSSPDRPLAIDVRAPREREQKYIAGSVGMPLNHLAENLETAEGPVAAGLLRGRLSVVHCGESAARHGFARSAKLPAASQRGKRRSCRFEVIQSRELL